MAALRYLDFDYSEDEHGCGSFEAMASTPPAQVAAVRAEIARVLDWAAASFPGQRAPLDDGGEWDFALHGQQEWASTETLDYDTDSRQFHSQLAPPGPARCTVTLSLSGSAQFCEAFRAQFAPD